MNFLGLCHCLVFFFGPSSLQSLHLACTELSEVLPLHVYTAQLCPKRIIAHILRTFGLERGGERETEGKERGKREGEREREGARERGGGGKEKQRKKGRERGRERERKMDKEKESLQPAAKSNGDCHTFACFGTLQASLYVAPSAS